MAMPEDDAVVRWTEDRLAQLAPPDDWTPQLARNRTLLREQLAHQSRHRRRRLIVAATAMIALVPFVKLPAVRAVAQQCGDWLLTASNAGRARVRPTVPHFKLVDADGRPVALSDFRGKVVLLTMWTTTCGQCQTEMSWFTAFQQAYRDRDFVVLGVALDRDGWDRVTPYLHQRPVNYEVVVGDRERAQSAIGPSIPTTLILDRHGRI